MSVYYAMCGASGLSGCTQESPHSSIRHFARWHLDALHSFAMKGPNVTKQLTRVLLDKRYQPYRMDNV